MGNTVKFAVGAALAVSIAIPAGAQDTGRPHRRDHRYGAEA